RLALGFGARDGGVAPPRMASVAGNRGRRGGACGCARDGRRPPSIGARCADLPDCFVRRGNAGGRHRAFRRTAGMGCELSAPMKEVCVSRTDDEKDLDRRNFLKCMAWAGTGAVWTLSSGILKGSPLSQSAGAPVMSHDGQALRFVQISDSHIGFDK